MTTTGTTNVDDVATGLRRWMRAVGGFYVLIGLFNTPPVIEARLPAQYPDLGAAVDSLAARALVDVWFMFGLEMVIVGTALIVFSRAPQQHVALVWTVLALELVRGIAHDVYVIFRGADPAFYGAWILVHALIIVSGLILVRRAGAAVVPIHRQPSG